MKARRLSVLEIPETRTVPGYEVDEDDSRKITHNETEEWVWKGRATSVEDLPLMPVLYLPEVVAKAHIDSTIEDFESALPEGSSSRIVFACENQVGKIIRVPRAVLTFIWPDEDAIKDKAEEIKDFLKAQNISMFHDIWGHDFSAGWGAPIPCTGFEDMEETLSDGAPDGEWSTEHSNESGTISKQNYPIREVDVESYIGGEVLVVYTMFIEKEGNSTFVTQHQWAEDGPLGGEEPFDELFPDEPGNPQVPSKFDDMVYDHEEETNETLEERVFSRNKKIGVFQITEPPTFGQDLENGIPPDHPGQWRLHGVHQIYRYTNYNRYKVQEEVLDRIAQEHFDWSEKCSRYKVLLITVLNEDLNEGDFDREELSRSSATYFKDALEALEVEVELVDGPTLEGDITNDLFSIVDEKMREFWPEEEE